MLWPIWGWRFLVVALSLWALMIYANRRAPSALVTRVRQHAEERV
jgi:hypothetical protein